MQPSRSSLAALCALVLATVACTDATPTIDRLLINTRPRVPVDMYESHCVLQGGVCRFEDDCPRGQLTSTKGLCPAQQSAGVECCYTRQREDTEMCLQQGGFCMPTAECGQTAEHQGLCSQGSVCCLELRDPTCNQSGGTCDSTRNCGSIIPGNFRDCGPQDSCCLLE